MNKAQLKFLQQQVTPAVTNGPTRHDVMVARGRRDNGEGWERQVAGMSPALAEEFRQAADRGLPALEAQEAREALERRHRQGTCGGFRTCEICDAQQGGR